MKKLITILCIAAVLANSAALTGCNFDKTGSNNSENLSSVTENSRNSEKSDNSSITESGNGESAVPERSKPSGEATFLIGPDGEPIYTDEITECLVYDENFKEFPAADGFTKENFSKATCEGFAYAYIPRPAVNFMENPELFEANKDGDRYYYKGEPLEPSSDFIRVYTGDKLGDFIVEAAKAYFSPLGYDGSDEAGQFYGTSYIKLSGEVELTGFVRVEKEAPLYPGNGGKICFYTDSASSLKIPSILFEREYKTFKPMRYIGESFFGCYGEGYTSGLWLGNISDYNDCGLREGDLFVKVKVVISGIDDYDDGFTKVDVKSIEVID